MKNVDANVKSDMLFEKRLWWNPATCNCENGEHLASIVDDLMIACDEIVES